MVDLPYRVIADPSGARAFNEDDVVLAFGADLRIKEKLVPNNDNPPRRWGNNLLDRHMLVVNYLCNYPVYNEMNCFMALHAVSAGLPI